MKSSSGWKKPPKNSHKSDLNNEAEFRQQELDLTTTYTSELGVS